MLWIIAAIIAALVIAGIITGGVYYRKKVQYEYKEVESFLIPEIENMRGDIRIFMTLTTIPARTGDLLKTLRALDAQTVLRTGDKIILNMPYTSIRQGIEYVIPSSLSRYVESSKYVEINRCEDVGPLTKVYPTLSLTDRDYDIIIPVDDDVHMPPSYYEELVHRTLMDQQHHDLMEMTVYAYHGLDVRGRMMGNQWQASFRFAQQRNGPTDVAETVAGAIYRRGFFGDIQVPDKESPCFLADDITIAAHMQERGIKRTLIESDVDTGVTRGRKGQPLVQNLAAPLGLHLENMSHGSRNKWTTDNMGNCRCLALHPDLLQSSN